MTARLIINLSGSVVGILAWLLVALLVGGWWMACAAPGLVLHCYCQFQLLTGRWLKVFS